MEMEFKISTIGVMSLDAPEKMREEFKKKSDIIADNDNWINLSHVEIGETTYVIGNIPKRNRMILNSYKRIN